MSADAATLPPPASTTPPSGVAASSGVSEPWAKEWIAPDFTLNHKALDRLPEHLKGLRPTLERQKNFEDVLTIMQNQQFLAGKKGLAPLPADAPKEVVAERKALLDTIQGVPKEPKEYNIKRPESIPEELWIPELVDGFVAWAHENSVPPGAVAKLVNLQTAVTQKQLAAQQQYEQQYWSKEQQAFEGVIRQENIPAERATALVEKGALALGLDLSSEKTKTFLKGADARLMAMRHAIAIGEDRSGTPGGQGEGSGGGVGDPAGQAADILSNPANPLHGPYWNNDGKYSRASHDAAVERHHQYLKQASAATTQIIDRRRR